MDSTVIPIKSMITMNYLKLATYQDEIYNRRQRFAELREEEGL